MLQRNEPYNPQLSIDAAPKRGNLHLDKLIAHFNAKGYSIITSDGEIISA